MPRLIWTPQVISDVPRLYRYLASKNIDAAQRAVQAIRQGVRVLALQSGMGRPIDDLPVEFREWLSTLATAAAWRATAPMLT